MSFISMSKQWHGYLIVKPDKSEAYFTTNLDKAKKRNKEWGECYVFEWFSVSDGCWSGFIGYDLADTNHEIIHDKEHWVYEVLKTAEWDSKINNPFAGDAERKGVEL